jgi:hypothetical protein
MKLQGKVTCRFLSRITIHSNLLTDEALAKVMRVFHRLQLSQHFAHVTSLKRASIALLKRVCALITSVIAVPRYRVKSVR